MSERDRTAERTLIESTRPFATEVPARTWANVAGTISLLAALTSIAALAHPWPLRNLAPSRDVFACLRLKLWDPARGHMVGYLRGVAQSTRGASVLCAALGRVP
jgi:hypothetical protein